MEENNINIIYDEFEKFDVGINLDNFFVITQFFKNINSNDSYDWFFMPKKVI